MGRVFWITGLSGAGKTTIGSKLYEYLAEKKANVIRLDGDNLRNVFLAYDYSSDARKNLGYQYARLCKLLCEQNMDVIICVMVMFDEIREWNRDNIPNYKEVFLDVSMEELVKRDQKGLYTKAMAGTADNVAGVNLEVELPKNPDLVIKNYGDISADDAVKMIIDHFGL